MVIESTVASSLLEIIIAIMQLQTTQALLDFIWMFDFVICAGRIENVCASTVGFIPLQMS